MRHKLMMGIAGLLLASSCTFAGWGVQIGVGGGHYGARERVFVGGGVPVRPLCGPSRPTYYAAPPVFVDPGRYRYVRPEPYYRGIPQHDRWQHRERARDIRRWEHRRY